MNDHPIHHTDLDALVTRAVASLHSIGDSLVAWAQQVRATDGAPGRFRWALETTRPANVAASAYLVTGLARMGLFDRVVTPADRQAGIAWVQAMDRGNGQYHDPALLDRPTPGWPAGKPWPAPTMQVSINQYAVNLLKAYGQPVAAAPEPPVGLPQADDPWGAVEWIKTRPWTADAWGAGSHAQRMATWLLNWHKEGRIPLEPLIAALRFIYEIQDPRTGLWGSPTLPKYNRINGTFKLFPLIREALDLPLPHAAKIIDEVLAEFYRPDYDATVGGCDEWDNWYVLALALEQVPGYRLAEIKKLAAWRIVRVLEIFRKPDGGLSYAPDACQTHWNGFDMAPKLPQSDVMGPGILAAGINVCIDLLGLHGAAGWTGQWRIRPKEPADLRQTIAARVFDQTAARP
jgi:hypothetical protein